MALAFDRRQLDIERNLLAALGEAVIATDLDGAIVFWNRAAEALYGWTADEVMGRNILDVTPTAMSRDEAAAIFARLLKGETWSGSFPTRRKDGTELVTHVTDYPVRDEVGRPTAIVGISRPITASVSTDPAPAKHFRLRSLLQGRPTVRQGLIAIAIYAGAVLVRLGIDFFMPGQFPFLTFLPATAIGAILVGPLYSLVLLGAFVATGLVWLDHYGNMSRPVPLTATGVFLGAGAVLIAVLTYAARASRLARTREEQIALLNNELQHRIRNLFALMTSICVQTIRGSDSLQEAAQMVTGRIQAVAAAQDLADRPGDGADLSRIIADIVRPLAPHAERLIVSGPPQLLSSTDTISLSLLLHELATNAIKHGAWAGSDGSVRIVWEVHNRSRLVLEWLEEVDAGQRPDESDGRRGFGSTLVRRALPHATVVHELRPGGAYCSVELPL